MQEPLVRLRHDKNKKENCLRNQFSGTAEFQLFKSLNKSGISTGNRGLARLVSQQERINVFFITRLYKYNTSGLFVKRKRAASLIPVVSPLRYEQREKVAGYTMAFWLLLSFPSLN